MSKSVPAPVIVDNDSQLNALCEQWQQCEYLALDTEFIRTDTFYSKIGLLQLADGNACYLIDPLLIEDWSAFAQLLSNEKITIVLHSCSEDLNLLYSFLGVTPAKLFDSQLAAAFLGIGFSISYQSLVKEFLDVEVDKDETRSNWLQRPLTAKQISYATADVFYLFEIYPVLVQRLKDKNVLSWCIDDCQALTNAVQDLEDEASWAKQYVNFSGAWRLNEQRLELLQRLCFWRERQARKRNRPKNWIVKDAEILCLAENINLDKSFDKSNLVAAGCCSEKFLNYHGDDIAACLSDPDLGLPAIDVKLIKQPLAANSRKKLKDCQKLVREIAEQENISPELLGRKKQLLSLVHQRESEAGGWPESLDNWRQPLLAEGVAGIFKSP